MLPEWFNQITVIHSVVGGRPLSFCLFVLSDHTLHRFVFIFLFLFSFCFLPESLSLSLFISTSLSQVDTLVNPTLTAK